VILACPGCGRRYRVADDAPRTRRLRCGGCARVFSAVEAKRPNEVGPGAGAAAAPPEPGGSLLALVGDEDREFRGLVRSTLESLGCRVEVTGDGEAAFRFAVARHPVLMVLNVYMTRLLGVAVCEGVKGSPDLKGTRVALVGSVFKSDRFVRHPGNLYGADDYFEDVIPAAQLRERLGALLGRGPEGAGASRASTSAPTSVARSGDSVTSGGAGAPEDVAANGADEPIDPRSEIHRLARIMVSDLKMYHPEEFRRAVVERRFSDTFREEMTQAKDLIGHRFPGMPDRMAVLAEALKEQIAVERAEVSGASAGSPG
jgi:predicted Zn finger-like uncharacterized protein